MPRNAQNPRRPFRFLIESEKQTKKIYGDPSLRTGFSRRFPLCSRPLPVALTVHAEHCRSRAFRLGDLKQHLMLTFEWLAWKIDPRVQVVRSSFLIFEEEQLYDRVRRATSSSSFSWVCAPQASERLANRSLSCPFLPEHFRLASRFF